MPLDIRIRFGRAIRRIREVQGINQEEAAERCGLHERTTAESSGAFATFHWSMLKRSRKGSVSGFPISSAGCDGQALYYYKGEAPYYIL